jgi:ribonuclease HI
MCVEHQEVLPVPADDPPEFSAVRHAVATCLASQPEAVQVSATCAHLEIYTDGSTPIVNPGGPAGFSALVLGWSSLETSDLPPALRLDLAGFIPARTDEPRTSNNRAEIAGILAALVAVEALPTAPASAVIWSDSEYAVRCATGRYQRKKNVDLWGCYDRVSRQTGRRVPDLHLEWLKGHAGNTWNEIADDLATRAAFDFDDAAYQHYRAAQRATGREMPGAAALAGVQPSPASRAAPKPVTDPSGWLRGAHYTLVLSSAIHSDDGPTVGSVPASGIYQLWTRSGKSARHTVIHAGAHSLDEAEYLTLIAALDDLLARIAANRRDPTAFSVTVYSQREVVVKQVQGSYHVRSTALQSLYAQVRARLDRFGRAEMIWRVGSLIAQLLRASPPST